MQPIPLHSPQALWDLSCVKLPHVWMVRYGPLAQTLAGIVSSIPNREGLCFASVGTIGKRCGLPASTVRKHLKELRVRDLIRHIGRKGRRSVTYMPKNHLTITWQTTMEAVRNGIEFQNQVRRYRQDGHDAGNGRYGLLPLWTCPQLRWGERAVFSIAVAKHKAAIVAGSESDETQFTLRYADLSKATGLNERSVGRALESLECNGLLKRLHRNGMLRAQYWTIPGHDVAHQLDACR